MSATSRAEMHLELFVNGLSLTISHGLVYLLFPVPFKLTYALQGPFELRILTTPIVAASDGCRTAPDRFFGDLCLSAHVAISQDRVCSSILAWVCWPTSTPTIEVDCDEAMVTRSESMVLTTRARRTRQPGINIHHTGVVCHLIRKRK